MQFKKKYIIHLWYVCIAILMLNFSAYGAWTVHILHPWASDTSRLNAGLWIQSSETGWYPGAMMSREAGGWFTYTFSNVDSSTNDRFELASFIPTRYIQYDSMVKYPGIGAKQLNFKEIISLNPLKKEVWIYVESITSYPRIEFEPPKCKVVNFFNPWQLGAPRVLLQNSSGLITMSSLKNFCGWLSYYHYDTLTSPVLRFVNSIDSACYGLTGLGDTNFIDLNGAFTASDTIWLLATPYPDGPPSVQTTFPGKTGDCTPISLASRMFDIGIHKDFGTAVTGLKRNMVKSVLGSTGIPITNSDSTTVTVEEYTSTI
jgi:hypothetical protein